ncbi:MAG: hypothetical protein V2I33_16205 [Kangiellaceae bacterium]|nr:hypothetical protein [Kangiellaceae bacterium]
MYIAYVPDGLTATSVPSNAVLADPALVTVVVVGAAVKVYFRITGSPGSGMAQAGAVPVKYVGQYVVQYDVVLGPML